MGEETLGDTVATALGGQIRAARRELGMTQVDLGEMLGIDEDYLGLAEQGRHPLYFDRLVEMLDAVGLALVAVPKSTLSDRSRV